MIKTALLKWVGSKNASKEKIADVIGEVKGNYFEPFLGGGSVAWELLRRNAIKGRKALSDNDNDLIYFWVVVQKEPKRLIGVIGAKLSSGIFTHENYYRIRDVFNGDLKDPDVCNGVGKDYTIERMALVIYLNKFGYNGLWRRNASGKFNTPVGDNAGINLTNITDEIIWHSKLIQDCQFDAHDYIDAMIPAGKNDAVYLDPPYYSENGKNNFTGYRGEVFTKEDMDSTYHCGVKCAERGARVFLSGPGYFVPNKEQEKHLKTVHVLRVPRFVNCKGEGRGDVEEKLLELKA